MDDRPSEGLLYRLEREATVGRLAAGTYHDLRHLLAGVSAMLEWAQSQTDPAARARAMEHATRYLGQAGDLMDASLRLSQPADHAGLRCDLDAVIADVDRLSRHQRPAGVRWQVELPPDTPPVAIAHATLVHLLLNLVLNAQRAMDGIEGDLTLQATIGADETVRLTITDQGPGISPELRSRIFGAFQRGDSDGGHGDSLGLGLWTARRYAESAGGSLELADHDAAGCCFVLTLPSGATSDSRQTAPSPATPPPETVADSPLGRVLVAEDDRLLLSCIAESLIGAGWDVVRAADGQALLDQLDASPGAYDLLIQDYLLPRVQGPELLAEIRRRCPALPIIVVSGWMGDDTPATLSQFGIASFLAKPFSMPKLLSAARQAVGRQ